MAKGSWASRWEKVKNQMTVGDLALDVTGKMLVALGLGAHFASRLAPHAKVLVIAGILLSVAIKFKYRKQLLG